MCRHIKVSRQRSNLPPQFADPFSNRPPNLWQSFAIEHDGNGADHTQFKGAESKHQVNFQRDIFPEQESILNCTPNRMAPYWNLTASNAASRSTSREVKGLEENQFIPFGSRSLSTAKAIFSDGFQLDWNLETHPQGRRLRCPVHRA